MNETMKDSGIEWIGKIPTHWEVKRMQDVGTYKKGPFGSAITLDMFVEQDAETIKIYEQKNAIQSNADLGWYYISYQDYKALKDFEVFSGDIIVSCAGTIGKCFIMPKNIEKGIINQALMKISLNEYINKEYFLYLFDISLEYMSNKYSNGSAIKNIPPFNVLKKQNIPFPIPLEQHQISIYLDNQCTKIDDIATDLEKQIEILKKYKKSLITETVTKGLDRSAPMKDSGIEWIGKIPTHWQVKRLKYVSKLKTGTTPSGNEGINYDNNGLCWFTPGDFNPNMKLTSSERYIDEQAIKFENITVYPKNSVLLVAIGATVGKIGYTFDVSYSNQQITAVIPNNILGKYLLYYISSKSEYIKENALYTTLPIINNAYLGNVYIVIPSKQEQIAIANFLDKKCSQIDSIIEGKKEQLSKLQQHKKSLIYEYVTGKKRVKGATENGN